MHWTPNAWKKENGGASSFPRLSPSSLEQPVFSLSERSTRSSAKRWEIHFSFSIGYFWPGGKYEYGERRENSSFLVGCTHCVQIGSDVPFPEEQIRKRDPDAPVMCPERKSKAAHSIYIAWKDWRVGVIGNQSLIRITGFDILTGSDL